MTKALSIAQTQIPQDCACVLPLYAGNIRQNDNSFTVQSFIVFGARKLAFNSIPAFLRGAWKKNWLIRECAIGARILLLKENQMKIAALGGWWGGGDMVKERKDKKRRYHRVRIGKWDCEKKKVMKRKRGERAGRKT